MYNIVKRRGEEIDRTSHPISMAMDVTFRWATEKDAGAILGLVRELAEFEKELDKVKTTDGG